MAIAHPSYANPTIVEALCEIHFVPDVDRSWSDSNPLPLTNILNGEFPIVEFLPEVAVSIDIRDGQQNASAQTTGQRLRISNSARNRHIQVAPGGNVLVFNVLAPYPGWLEVSTDIQRLWKLSSSILKPVRVTGIGLRYINRVLHDDACDMSSWLKPTRNIPLAFIEACRGSRLYIEIQHDGARRSIYRIANFAPGIAGEKNSIIFDIDKIWRSDQGVEIDSVREIAEQLHEDIWADFSESVSERYTTHLGEGQ